MNNKVLIFGGNHHNTLGVLRTLGQKNIKSELIVVSSEALEDVYIASSKYIVTAHACSSYEEAYSYIITHYSGEKHRPVIICTSDAASSTIDLHFDAVKDKFYVPNAKIQGRITQYMDKETMRLAAESVGLNTPKSWFINSDSALDEISYPCITKPIKSINGSKADIIVCKNINELKNCLNKHTFVDGLQIQEFISCDYEYQLIGCSLDGGEKVIIPGVSNVIRPAKNTNTGFLRYERLNNTYPINACIEFLKKVGYSGLFSMEFLRDQNGRDYFMEINMRNDGNAICVTAAGVNLPYLWYAYNTGIDKSAKVSSDIKEVYVMPEIDELMAVLKGYINPFVWIRDIFRTDCFMEYDKSDSKPFKKRLKQTLNLLFKKIFRCK